MNQHVRPVDQIGRYKYPSHVRLSPPIYFEKMISKKNSRLAKKKSKLLGEESRSAKAAPISGKDSSSEGDPAPNQADKRIKEKPVIYVLEKSHWPTVFRQMHKPLLDTLELVATVKFARNGDEATRALASEPHAVLLAHHECVPDSDKQINSAFFDYMCGGGTVILMGNCVAATKYVDLNRFLRDFGVGWTVRDRRWAVRDNVLNDTPETMKYNYLEKEIKGIDAYYVRLREKDEAWYVATDSRDNIDALVAVGKIGNGRLGFIGDKYSRGDKDVVVLAMCGLLGLAKPDRTWVEESGDEAERADRGLLA